MIAEEETPDWVSTSVKLLAALISLVVMGVSVMFIFRLHVVTNCDSYTCPKARFLGPDDPNPYLNHTVDFYRCEEQRYLLKSMWGFSLVLFGPVISAILAFTSLLVNFVTTPKIIGLMKNSYLMSMILYTSFVSQFQEKFESISDIMAYVRSLILICILILILFFMSACSVTEKRLNRMMFAVMVIVGLVLLFHVGYSCFHLMCGRGTLLLPGYLVSHCSLVFSFSMFHDDIFPHAALAMALFIIPPICPFVIALIAWSFDTFWKDLCRMGRHRNFGRPSIPRIPGMLEREEHRNYRREGNCPRGRHRIRRGYPTRGIN
ncbi:hypothetical protein GE061_007259 [Apolygus lucorum]|uniref:Uncharacterized protein n=1 Tax=Apolygus lucorum TaxID=248454 RepID=A0A6A4IVR5_APOLU|nr:hypothetical protein GE061_007259 [Apolygus lucorum]